MRHDASGWQVLRYEKAKEKWVAAQALEKTKHTAYLTALDESQSKVQAYAKHSYILTNTDSCIFSRLLLPLLCLVLSHAG